MTDMENGGILPDKEQNLLRLAVGFQLPGAVRVVRMAEAWRKDTVARTRIPDFSGGLITIQELAVLEQEGIGPPYEERGGSRVCEKWSLALWIWRTAFPDDLAGKR